MFAVILDATTGDSELSSALAQKLKHMGVEYTWFRLAEADIKPCRSCSACAFKSPGVCVQKDDIHDMMRVIAPSSLIIMLTPVRFGGYASELKKVIDRLMVICIPEYRMKQGRLIHPARYGAKTLLAAGITKGPPDEQTACFKKLVERNAFNMQFDYRALCFDEGADFCETWRELRRLVEEVAS